MGEAAKHVTKEAVSPAAGLEISVSAIDLQSRRDMVIGSLRPDGNSPAKDG
jgi:hypothetical protein